MLQGKWWLIVVAVVVLLPVIWLFVQAQLASRPTDLGVRDGRLRGCPPSPNCVSTEADTADHRAERLAFVGEAEEAREDVLQALAVMGGNRLVSDEPQYVHAEFTSAIFRFVDDVEFFIDSDARQIQYRSASRVGYSDMGKNRQRMEAFVNEFSRLQESRGATAAETPESDSSADNNTPQTPSEAPSESNVGGSTPAAIGESTADAEGGQP